jgi:hypothetical protein
VAFKYAARKAESWEKRANQQGGDFIGFINPDYKTFTPVKGDNFIRILPPTWDDPEHYGFDIYAHYGVGPDRGSVLCLHKMKNLKCPLCEAAIRAQRSGDEELFKELSARKRVLVWMLDRKDEKKGPMIWSMPWSLDRDFCKLSRDPKTGEIYPIDHPEEGYDISFDRQGDALTTKYVGVQIARRSSSVDQDYLDFIQEEPLDKALTWMTYDEIRDLYEGGGDGGPREERARPDDRRDDRRHESRGAREEQAQREERQPPPQEERPAPEEKPNFKRRGSAASSAPPKDPDDDGYTQPKASNGNGNGHAREEPAAEERASPPPSGGKSRAEELRERFKR